MELDTGSAVTIISKEDYKDKFSSMKLRDTDLRLSTHTGKKMKLLGVLPVTVEINNQTQRLDLMVVDRGSTPLFGRDWLNVLQLNWKAIAKSFSKTNKRASKRCDK